MGLIEEIQIEKSNKRFFMVFKILTFRRTSALDAITTSTTCCSCSRTTTLRITGNFDRKKRNIIKITVIFKEEKYENDFFWDY